MPIFSVIAWHRLGEYLHETRLLGSIQRTLYWDQNTVMPPQGAHWRGEQLTLLASYLHSRQSSAEFEELILEAKAELEEAIKLENIESSQSFDRLRNIELLEKELHRQKRLDPDLVALLALTQARGYNTWKIAKENNDYPSFAVVLKDLISLRKEQAKQLSEERSCWETLAQPFEPDLTLKRLKELFDPLKKRLPELLEVAKTIESSTSIKWDLDEKAQEFLSNQLLKQWGRDFRITSLARSPHPFSITLGPQDFRITTRVVKGQPLSCFLAIAHEWGHSLYEQGLPTQSHQWFDWPLGEATSMGLHESQSLFWENRIARSLAFSKRFWRVFADAGAPINSGFQLWHYMNPLKPGLNRVEADELSYGMHILIRTDLEIALLEEGLDVMDLPNEWNEKYQDLLGVRPRNDSEGCLQDVHWSEGQFGYFPSYLLGHLISAQLSEAMNKSFLSLESSTNGLDPIDFYISKGNEEKLLGWLRDNVHPYGRKVNAEELVEEVTERPLCSSVFLKYLEKKLNRLIEAS